MHKSNRVCILLSSGLVLIVLSVAGFLFDHFRTRPLSFDTKTLYEERGWPDSIIFSSPIRLHIDSPSHLHVGSSDVIKATRLDVYPIFKVRNPRNPDTPSFQLQLYGAGLQIEPEDWVPLAGVDRTNVSSAAWKVRAVEAGQYDLILYVQEGSTWSDLPLAIDQPKFRIDVTTKWPESLLTKILPSFVAFMGLLLTLLGIFSSRKNRRKEREKSVETPLGSVL